MFGGGYIVSFQGRNSFRLEPAKLQRLCRPDTLAYVLTVCDLGHHYPFKSLKADKLIHGYTAVHIIGDVCARVLLYTI